MSADVRIAGDLLHKRISLPSLMFEHSERTLMLTEAGDWIVQDIFEGEVMHGYDAHRRGDTGETTEWMLFPSWSRGIGMSVELLRGQMARVSYVADNKLRVRISDGEIEIVDATYTDSFLVVREMTARPVDTSNVKEGAFL